MNTNELIATSPISVAKTARQDKLRSITSCQPGKIVPLAYFPLLREDAVARGNLRISFEMAETMYPLLNAVNCKVMVHFISHLAFERFDGFDSFNRSYQGEPEPSTGTPIPFVNTMAFAKAAEIWKALGVQWPEGASINRSVVEAYNLLVNFRRRARTDKLPVRALTDTTLAEAFWRNTGMVGQIVPDWDQAAMDGNVELQFAVPKLPISGLGRKVGNAASTLLSNVEVYEGYTGQRTYPFANETTDTSYVFETGSGGTPTIFAELQNAGVTVSLANIELAKKTAAFAKLREKYDGLDDEHIIDLLMEGIRVPDAAMKQPILLATQSTIFGMTERKAMDGDSLDVSRTTGQTAVTVTFRAPPMNTGGVILVTCEIVPEQLYERQGDVYLGTTDPAKFPNFMRDYLDPEKVEVVQNKFVDVHHSAPTATFGYAPLNHAWQRDNVRAGGKFYRPNPDTFVEDRLRFWSADVVDPTLTDDFYMVSGLPNSVFADTEADPFEVVTIGSVAIVGNTVFGDRLEEDTGSYEEIMSQVDTDRIEQNAAVLLAAEEAEAETGDTE